MHHEPRDCTFDEDGRWFRLRACAVLIRDGSLTTSGLPERCEWVPIAEFGASGRMYPEFFGTELAELPSAPKLIATRTPS